MQHNAASNAFDNSSFSKIADSTLNSLVDIIEDEDKNGEIDLDFLGDIISLKTASGTFIINKHSTIQEIWLASPISGPYHFRHIDGTWKTKNGTELLPLLTKELKINFDLTI